MIKTTNQMNRMHKIIFLFCGLFAYIVQANVYGTNIELQQKNKNKNKSYNPSEVVKVTSRGEGKDRDEAINMALRDALERTNQSFISSISLFSDEEIGYDEIVRVTKGNIAKFDVLYGDFDNKGRYSVLIDAYISATNLANYVENKGGSVRVKGFDFIQNHMQKTKLALFYKENELKAIYNLFLEMSRMCGSLYDYSIASTQPTIDNNIVNVRLVPTIKENSNYTQFINCITNTLSSLSIPNEEIAAYKSANLGGPYIYRIDNGNSFYLRNQESVDLLKEYIPFMINYGKAQYCIEDNIGKKYKANNQKEFMLKYSVDDFQKIESFSITPILKPVAFSICKDPLASITDKVKVGFSGHVLQVNRFGRPEETSDGYICRFNSSQISFYPNSYSSANFETSDIDINISRNILQLKFYSPIFYNYKINGTNATVYAQIVDDYKKVIEKLELKLNKSTGIGLPQFSSSKSTERVLEIGFVNGDIVRVKVPTAIDFEKVMYNDKSYIRNTYVQRLLLDDLHIEGKEGLSPNEKKRFLCRKLSVYPIRYFKTDVDEFWFQCYKKGNYDTPETPLKRYPPFDIKGFYRERVPRSELFLFLFYKIGTKCKNMEEFGLANIYYL